MLVPVITFISYLLMAGTVKAKSVSINSVNIIVAGPVIEKRKGVKSMRLKLSNKNGAVIEFNQFYYKDMIVSHCPNEIKYDNEYLKNRCYLNDCVVCWQKAFEERGFTFELIH